MKYSPAPGTHFLGWGCICGENRDGNRNSGDPLTEWYSDDYPLFKIKLALSQYLLGIYCFDPDPILFWL